MAKISTVRTIRTPVTIDSGIPELSSWEAHTIDKKVGLTLWEKLGLQAMADQRPLPFNAGDMLPADNPFNKRKA